MGGSDIRGAQMSGTQFAAVAALKGSRERSPVWRARGPMPFGREVGRRARAAPRGKRTTPRRRWVGGERGRFRRETRRERNEARSDEAVSW